MSLFILVGVMSYYWTQETAVRSQLELSLQRLEANNHQNKQTYEACSNNFLSLKENVQNNMKNIRNIDPQKKELEESLKKCNEELSKISK